MLKPVILTRPHLGDSTYVLYLCILRHDSFIPSTVASQYRAEPLTRGLSHGSAKPLKRFRREGKKTDRLDIRLPTANNLQFLLLSVYSSR
jgi:hypothetical protein